MSNICIKQNGNIMNTRFLNLSKIEFESNYNEARIAGTVKEGNLSYESEFIINQKQLNIVVNELYQNNENFDLQDNLSSIEIAPNEFLYSIQLNNLSTRGISLSQLEPYNSIVQICA